VSSNTNQAIVLLDGGIGQEISRRSMRSEPHPLWSVMVMREEPDVVIGVHRDFIDAGARVVTLNNYSATPIRMRRAGMEDDIESIHSQASALLDEAINQSGIPRSQISKMGCLPPLAASYVSEAAPNYETARRDFEELIRIQKDYVDGFLVETMSNTTELRAARDALVSAGESVHIGLTIHDDGTNRLRSGEPLAQAIETLSEGPVESIMINCSQPEVVPRALEDLKKLECAFGAYANGFTTVAPLEPGGTVKDLECRVDLSPEVYTTHVMQWIAAGATIVGGCCEISPSHIKHLNDTLQAFGLSTTNLNRAVEQPSSLAS
jgi:homocysteine S-methyltransferase